MPVSLSLDEFPRPGDSDQQQSDQEVADEPQSAVRVQDEINAPSELESERYKQAASTVAGYPTLFPGTRPNSETASALVKAKMELAARTCWMTTGRSGVLWRGATDMATNKRPVTAAAEAAIAANRSRYVTIGTGLTLLTELFYGQERPRPTVGGTAWL